MIHHNGIRSVPAMPASWRDASTNGGPWNAGNKRWSDDDDFEGGRNWALIILFAALLTVPVLPCIIYLVI